MQVTRASKQNCVALQWSMLYMSSKDRFVSKDMSETQTTELAAAPCPSPCYFVCFQLVCQWELFLMVALATESMSFSSAFEIEWEGKSKLRRTKTH